MPNAHALSTPEKKLPFAEVTPTGLIFDAKASPSLEDVKQSTRQIISGVKLGGLCLGDIMNYGRSKFGQKYDDFLATTGYDYQTLANYCWVAKSVKLSVRTEILDFRHHETVAALKPEDQEHWLTLAAKHTQEGDYVSASRLRASIASKTDQLLPPLQPGAHNAANHDNKQRKCYIANITALDQQVFDWRDSGRFESMTEAEKQSLRDDLIIHAQCIDILRQHDCWPECETD